MSDKKLLILAFALVFVANLLILGKVAYNRAVVTAELEFSERELSPTYYRHDFDGGTALRLNWRVSNANDYWNNELKVNPRIIKDLGFKDDCARYRSAERKAYVLMELGGAAWQNAKQLDILRLTEQMEKADDEREKNRIQKEIDEWDAQHTKLYATAVAADGQSLKSLIKDAKKQFILTGTVTADCKDSAVYIRSLSIDELNVAQSLLPDGKLPSRYSVHVAVGALGDAWIMRVEPN